MTDSSTGAKTREALGRALTGPSAATVPMMSIAIIKNSGPASG